MSTPSQRPLSASALRGAVDLSSLRPRGGAPGGSGGAGTAPVSSGAAGSDGSAEGLLLEITDAGFAEAIAATGEVPAVLAIWASQVPGSREYIGTLVSMARTLQGRLRVLSLDLDAQPGAAQALTPVLQQSFGQITAMPVVLAVIQGQPMPLFQGPVPEDQVRPVLDQVLEAAAANGVTGRVDLGDGAPDEADEQAEPEDALSPDQAAAYEAIEGGDWAGAVSAYERILAQNPQDEEARLGVAQVRLMQRADGHDLDSARTAAQAAPDDLDAQTLAADVEVLSGLPEDAFDRLVGLVRRTAGDERGRVREHLVGLFDLVGPQDPRVVAARRDLMSALF